MTATCSLGDLLPGGILEQIATFLAPPSRILFAITVTPPSSPYDIIMARSKPKTSNLSIAGNDWFILNFGDIEKELAAKLTDDDINEVLLHIDAAHKVKRLFLTNCTNITGSGLRSLRHSTSIEQIDLGLNDLFTSKKLDSVPTLSFDAVLPILESIIRMERNSLKHLQFPHIWRDDDIFGNPNPHVDRFLTEYNEMMENRDTASCGTCNRKLNIDDYGIDLTYEDWRYGVQEYTCCMCTTSYCVGCSDDNSSTSLSFCSTCDRWYCSECSIMDECRWCETMYCWECRHTKCAEYFCSSSSCSDCISFECRECGKSWCPSCQNGHCFCCFYCFANRCNDCSEMVGVNGVHKCDDHDCEEKTCCDKCRAQRCQKGDNNCKNCASMVSSLLLEENKKMLAELEELKRRKTVLDQGHNDLKDENERMRKKLSLIRSMAEEK